ncbi:MAG: TatD DNase family protein [Woeseiaceae bacterium]|jgi:TatD DNase family protein
MTPDLIDIGANLTHESFTEDFQEVIQRATDAGVNRIILTGSSEQGSCDAAALAESDSARFRATAGVHPHHAAEYSDVVHQTLLDLLERDAVVAVGECGLDYFRDFSPREDQRNAFRRQLELAQETQLPVFLHQRDAHEDFLSLLQPAIGSVSRGVAHCFTGAEAELRAYLELDLYIGVTGWICDERRGAHLKEIIGLIPADRLLIETDAPYLMPRTLRPKPKSRRNEPAHLREVLRVIATVLERSELEIAAETTANAERFFSL